MPEAINKWISLTQSLRAFKNINAIMTLTRKISTERLAFAYNENWARF